MIELTLPEDPSGRLLWEQLALLWLVALYLPPGGPYGREEALRLRGAQLRVWRWRQVGTACAGGLVAAVVPGLSLEAAPARLLLAVGFAASAVILPLLRHHAAGDRSSPAIALTVELVAVPSGVVALGLLVAATDLTLRDPLVRLPVSPGALSGATLLAGAGLYLVVGGTHVVRSILDAVTAKPERNGVLDVPEYNRGRVIGALERLLLILFAVLGSYQAMAIVIAAKGLVRWSDLKDREFAEYFLIGSLTSLLLALAVGAVVRVALGGG